MNELPILKENPANHINREFWDEDGFSTVGVAIALLLTLSLIFSAAGVYQVNSASADVQNVADVGALAAENEVAEFYVMVYVCDAVVLSMSITAILLTLAGTICSCIPPVSAFGANLLAYSTKVTKAKYDFSKSAVGSLNTIQKMLPLISAANASAVISANSGGNLNVKYTGSAIPFPISAPNIGAPDMPKTDELQQKAKDNQAELAQEAEKAEEATKAANEMKQRAFQLDCGDSPNYCLHERSEKLAGLGGYENPMFNSADTWTFPAPLSRAREYYVARYNNEFPASSSEKEIANSALRKIMFGYALEALDEGYVRDDGTNFYAYLPTIPKNNAELANTHLYTDKLFPVSGDGVAVMHAHEGCSGISEDSGISSYGSVMELQAGLDTGTYEVCEYCEFNKSSLGNVASATSNTQVGFEYYYRQISDLANRYQEEREKATPATDKTKEIAQGIFDKAGDAIAEAFSFRIEAKPPGHQGCIAFAVSSGGINPNMNFNTSFVHSDSNLENCAAISSAILAEDTAKGGENVVTSILDGIGDGESGGHDDIGSIILDVWSCLLNIYSGGTQTLLDGLDVILESISLNSDSGLGKWAHDSVVGILEGLGLTPAKLSAPKPILANTSHVLKRSDIALSNTLLNAKSAAMQASTLTGENIFDKISGALHDAIAGKSAVLDIVIGEVSPIGGEATQGGALKFSLPPAIKQSADSLISGATGSVSALVDDILTGGAWR